MILPHPWAATAQDAINCARDVAAKVGPVNRSERCYFTELPIGSTRAGKVATNKLRGREPATLVCKQLPGCVLEDTVRQLTAEQNDLMCRYVESHSYR